MQKQKFFCLTTLFALVLIPALIFPSQAKAVGYQVWQKDGIPVSTISGNNEYPIATVTDNNGGAYIVWRDYGSTCCSYTVSENDFVQHFNSYGVALWTQPIPVVSSHTNTFINYVKEDTFGGIILSGLSYDPVSHSSFAFLQRISSDGQFLWGPQGIFVADTWDPPLIEPDGMGGVLAFFNASNDGVIAQRISENGIVLWEKPISQKSLFSKENTTTKDDLGTISVLLSSSSGIVCTATIPLACSKNLDIYAQRIDLNGNLLWPIDMPVVTASDIQELPEIITDGNNGVIVSWRDKRNGFWDPSSWKIYAQRLYADGSPSWDINGIVIASSLHPDTQPKTTSDADGGVIVVWEDNRRGINRWGGEHRDIYAQRVDGNGNLKWQNDGTLLSSLTELTTYFPEVVSDGRGGAIIVWNENSSQNPPDPFVQRIDHNGMVRWGFGGIPASEKLYGQYYYKIVSDGNGGAIIAWIDQRTEQGGDIYIQRVNETLFIGQQKEPLAVLKTIFNNQNKLVRTNPTAFKEHLDIYNSTNKVFTAFAAISSLPSDFTFREAIATLNGNDVSASISVDSSITGQIKVSSSSLTISPGDTFFIDLVLKYALAPSGPYLSNQWFRTYPFTANLALNNLSEQANITYPESLITIKSDETTGISGFVKNASNIGVGDITVTLSNLESATTLTETDGFYSFLGLYPGIYTLRITDSNGSSITQQIQVSQNSVAQFNFQY